MGSWSIPRSTTYSIKPPYNADGTLNADLAAKTDGLKTWVVQKVANDLLAGDDIVTDGVWRGATTAQVKRLQRFLGVADDAVIGPKTQQAITKRVCARFEALYGLPSQVLYSQFLYESGGYLLAVNWSVDGGVDCGFVQRRVYEADYNNIPRVKEAFDAVRQAQLVAEKFKAKVQLYVSRGRTYQLSVRLAALFHNYQVAAEKISQVGVNGLSDYYRTPQEWTKIVPVYNDSGQVVGKTWLKFPDGAPVKTPLEWCQRYSLGAPAHNEPGQAVKHVQW